MQRLLVSSTRSFVLSLSLCLVFGGQAAAAGSKVAQAMGDLRWGMNEGEVIRHVQRKLKETYEPLIRKETNLRREEQLRDELRDKTLEVRKSLVEFEGQKSNWDVSNIAGEYTHGNSESMLVTKDRDSATYYFFIEGRLWKWIKTYDASVFGGPDFKRFQKAISKKFGNGHVKQGERNEERGSKQSWVEFMDRNTRLRAVDDTEFYGNFALVFEEMDTVRQLASLRTNTIKRGGKKKDTALAGITDKSSGMKTESPVDKITGKDRRKAGELTHKKRRSLFAEEQKEESQAQYEARRKREEAAAKAKQRRAYERKERKKLGKALDGVPSAEEDDDPLSGI